MNEFIHYDMRRIIIAILMVFAAIILLLYFCFVMKNSFRDLKSNIITSLLNKELIINIIE